MDISIKPIIKQEIISFETQDANDNFLKIDCNVNVKIENNFQEYGADWSIQNHSYDNKRDDSLALDFNELKELCCERCTLCCSTFHNKYSLLKHNIKHLVVPLKQLTVYQCNDCSEFFKKKKTLITHIKKYHIKRIKHARKHPDLLHKCKFCSKLLKYKHLHAHLNNEHSSYRLKCSECKQTFKHTRYLQKHVLYTHCNVKFNWASQVGCNIKCDDCPKRFKNRDCLMQHVKNCHRESVQCTICGSKLKSQSYLNAHIRRVHYNDGKKHSCDICFKQFKSPRYLNVHIKNSHVNKTEHNCTLCGKLYKGLQSLENHLQKCSIVNVEKDNQ